MKSLFESIFGLLFFAIIIANLPTIIGFISLCVIVKVVYSILSSSDTDNTGNKETTSYNQTTLDERQNVKSEYQTKREQKTENNTSNSSGKNSGYSYSRPRYTNDDDYDNSYDSYYDDWRDDLPPEEGDGWHGTGNPFV